MDLRWQDSTGDTFVLRNEQTLIELLREHHPHWTEGYKNLGFCCRMKFAHSLLQISHISCV